MVSIGPGTLAEEVPVAIAPLAEADLPLAVPNYLTFGAAFNLDLHGASLHEPAQLAVPVPSSFASGTTAYFLRHDILMGPDGNPHPVWIVMDKGTVSADGFARTASPPYPGFSAGGQYLCALHDSPAGLVDLVMSIAGYRPPSSGFRSFAFAIGLGVAVELEGRLPLPNAMQIAMGIWGYSGDHWGSIPLATQVVTVNLYDGTREQSVVITSDPPVSRALPLPKYDCFAPAFRRQSRLLAVGLTMPTLWNSIWETTPPG